MIKEEQLTFLKRKIEPFEEGKDSIWKDPCISQQMLKAHLNEEGEGATRRIDFVKKSVAWLAETFPPAKYPKLLDLGCGPGIYAESLANQGYKVKGIDFSENSISYAEKSAEAGQLKIDYETADYLEADLGRETFDLALMIYCDFGVLAPEKRSLILQKVLNALVPGGFLVFDAFTCKHTESFHSKTSWSVEEESFWSRKPCLHLQETRNYPEIHTTLDRHLLMKEEKTQEFLIWETVFAPEELKALILEAGYRAVEVYGDVSGAPFRETSETACFVCKK